MFPGVHYKENCACSVEKINNHNLWQCFKLIHLWWCASTVEHVERYEHLSAQISDMSITGILSVSRCSADPVLSSRFLCL